MLSGYGVVTPLITPVIDSMTNPAVAGTAPIAVLMSDLLTVPPRGSPLRKSTLLISDAIALRVAVDAVLSPLIWNDNVLIIGEQTYTKAVTGSRVTKASATTNWSPVAGVSRGRPPGPWSNCDTPFVP